MSSPPLLAILDDYLSTAPPHFQDLVSSSRITMSSFPNTLLPSQQEELITRLQPYSIICTMRERTPLSRFVLSQLPNLKLLLTTGPFNRGIDTQACEDLGIVYAGTSPLPVHDLTKGYSSTNEHTWALILGLAKNIASDDLSVKSTPKGWQNSLAFSLAGKKLGVLGLGSLGAQCAVTGKLGFGMDVICWSENLTQDKADVKSEAVGLPKGSFKVVASKSELFEESDVLSVHYVLSERSKGMIGAEELDAMKKSAILINTSRGPLIDEQALLRCLKEGRIWGAALDVYDTEPLPADSEWRTTQWGVQKRSKVVLSPHMGYVDEESVNDMYAQQAQNVTRWLDGREVICKIMP